MTTFLFIDDEYEELKFYTIAWEMAFEKLKEEFEKVYVKLTWEYWDCEQWDWEFDDFYDELCSRLNKVWIILYKPNIVCHNDLHFNDD